LVAITPQFIARRTAIAVFWAALAFAFICAVLPAERLHLGDRDKVEHVLTFFTLTVLATCAYPRRALVVTGLLLLGFGASIEVAQALPFVNRMSDVADLVADAGGIMAASSLLALTGARFKLLRLLRPAPDFVNAVHGR
jgi:hypothetical protein